MVMHMFIDNVYVIIIRCIRNTTITDEMLFKRYQHRNTNTIPIAKLRFGRMIYIITKTCHRYILPTQIMMLSKVMS